MVCQHYWPEPFNVTDVCETLASRGHEVTVLTGLPNAGMPSNDVLAEYKTDKSLRRETRNGVNILRSWLWPRKTGMLNRILCYLSFWGNANKLAKTISDNFDVVLGYQLSPVMQVDPGLNYSKRTGTPFFLYCFDLWPESLVAGGIRRNSAVFKWVKKVSARIYGAADVLAVTSPGFYDYFEKEFGIVPARKVCIPQYAEDLFDFAGRDSGLDDLLFSPNLTHFMFAGNVGKAQSVGTIIDAADFLRDYPACFHIVGSGSDLENCKEKVQLKQLNNVVFHGRRELEEMPAYYSKADAMLVTLAGSPTIGDTLPRKVQSYLAAAKPVIGALGREGKRVIEKASCGMCCDAEDAKGLSELCSAFMKMDIRQREALGRNARTCYEMNYSKQLFFNRLEAELERTKELTHDS